MKKDTLKWIKATSMVIGLFGVVAFLAWLGPIHPIFAFSLIAVACIIFLRYSF